jgi:hypothetical protein
MPSAIIQLVRGFLKFYESRNLMEIYFFLACNAMETLLIHEDLFNDKNSAFFNEVCNMLKSEGVKINSGPKLNSVSAVASFKFFFLILLNFLDFNIRSTASENNEA